MKTTSLSMRVGRLPEMGEIKRREFRGRKMSIPLFESAIQWLGGLPAYSGLVLVLYSFWRGTRQPAGCAIRPFIQIVLMIVGTLLCFSGMFLLLLLWARLTLGKNYIVSTDFGAQLFKGQQLITSGPYAIVRHPMYAGLILAALGSLLIYATWTTVYFTCFAPLMFVRARREETALSAEFGEQWREYCRRVPIFLPHFRKEHHA